MRLWGKRLQSAKSPEWGLLETLKGSGGPKGSRECVTAGEVGNQARRARSHEALRSAVINLDHVLRVTGKPLGGGGEGEIYREKNRLRGHRRGKRIIGQEEAAGIQVRGSTLA